MRCYGDRLSFDIEEFPRFLLSHAEEKIMTFLSVLTPQKLILRLSSEGQKVKISLLTEAAAAASQVNNTKPILAA